MHAISGQGTQAEPTKEELVASIDQCKKALLQSATIALLLVVATLVAAVTIIIVVSTAPNYLSFVGLGGVLLPWVFPILGAAIAVQSLRSAIRNALDIGDLRQQLYRVEKSNVSF